MRALVLTDLHANAPALEAVLATAEGEWDTADFIHVFATLRLVGSFVSSLEANDHLILRQETIRQLDGAIQHAAFPQENQTFSMALGVTMGWLGLLIGWKFVAELGWTAALLGLVGGAVYTIGMVLLITNRPRLWPRVFSYHEVFHIMVVTATSIHFAMVWRILPQAA